MVRTGIRAGSRTPAKRSLAAWMVCALALSYSPARAAGGAAPDTAFVPRLSVPQAIEQMKSGRIQLVDVRPLAERSLGHVRGDVHAPFDVPGSLEAVPASPRAVFYCSCPAEELALEVARRAMRAGRHDVAVLVGGYDAWRAAGAPFAVDATWEETFRVDAEPSGWGKQPADSADCRYLRDTTQAYRGSASGCVRCAEDGARRGLAGLIQRIDAGEIAGRMVTLSAMVRSRGVGGIAFLWVGAEDEQGRMIAMTRADRDPIRGDSEWHAATVTGGIPSNATKLLFGVSLGGAGQVWLDEVRVVAEEDGGLPRVRLVVENAGFEE